MGRTEEIAGRCSRHLAALDDTIARDEDFLLNIDERHLSQIQRVLYKTILGDQARS